MRDRKRDTAKEPRWRVDVITEYVAAAISFGVMIAMAVAIGVMQCGCGGTSQAQARGIHAALNAVSDVGNPAYRAAFVACDAREQAVEESVAVADTEKMERISAIRVRCNRVFAAFEQLRVAQLEARAAASLAMNNADVLEKAIALLQIVRRAWRSAAQAVREELE